MREITPYGAVFILLVILLAQNSNITHFKGEVDKIERDKDSLLNVISENKKEIKLLMDSVNQTDTIILERIIRSNERAEIDHAYIRGVDSLSNDSIYKLLTERYFK